MGCNPGPLRRLSSLLPDPFEVGKGVKWGISHPTPTYQHMVKRFEVKTLTVGGGAEHSWRFNFSPLSWLNAACLLARLLLPNAPVLQTRAEQGWVAVAVGWEPSIQTANRRIFKTNKSPFHLRPMCACHSTQPWSWIRIYYKYIRYERTGMNE